METPRKCGLYLRVSGNQQTVQPQRAELEEYVRHKGWIAVDEWADVISGRTGSRDGLDAMLESAKAGEIDCILVVKLDRLGRSITHLLGLFRDLDAIGVSVVATSQGIDTAKSNPMGRFMIHILAAVAEFERSLISERTKAGLAVARANGKKLGTHSKLLIPNWREVVGQWLERPLNDRCSYKNLGNAMGGVCSTTARDKALQMEAEMMGRGRAA